MQEFSSVTASSYDADSLVPMLTEKAGEGWSVVSIVSAGTNVVAYLTRGGQGASTSASVAPSTTAEVTSDAGRTPDEDNIIAIDANEAASDAVEASGEPGGWGAVADTPSVPDSSSLADSSSTPKVPDADDSGLGAVAGGIGATAGAAAMGGAPLTGDTGGEASSAFDSAGDTATGVSDDSTDASQDTAGSTSGVPDGATDDVAGAAEHAGAPGGTAMSGATDTAAGTGSGLADSIGDATSGAVDTTTDASTSDTATAADTTTDAGAGDPAASGVPAGWYADPSGRFELRYWDGNAWTEHVSRAGQQYTDPPVA